MSCNLVPESNYRQYKISDWHQLADCRSNASPDLRIRVGDFVQNEYITGTNIRVEHPAVGVLFAYTILPKGRLTLDLPDTFDTSLLVHRENLLAELKRYGFYIEYQEELVLPDQIKEILKTALTLGYTKVRLIRVWDRKRPENAVIRAVAFNPDYDPDTYIPWMQSGYSCNDKEYETAIVSGNAMNLASNAVTDKYSWDWLYNVVYDIHRLLFGQKKNTEAIETVFTNNCTPSDHRGSCCH